MPTKQIEKLIEAAHVSCRYLIAKLLEAEGVNALQFDLGGAAKPQLCAFVPAVAQ